MTPASNTPGVDPTAYRERVYEAFADRSKPFGEAIEAALSAGSDRLGVDIGFLTSIEDGTQHVEHAVGDHDAIQPGEQCPLEEAYCRRTVQLDGHLSVQDAQASSEVSETAYAAFGLGSYIGSKIVVDDTVYGTVCFADGEPRETAFSEAEELFVELVARLVGRAIERRAYERRQSEQTERLRAEKRRFEGIAENSFDIIYRIDRAGVFSYVSDAVTRVLGYDPDELVGDRFLTYLTDESAQTAVDAFERLLAGEELQGLELTFEHRDGTPVAIEVNATALTDDDGTTAIQGVGRDITERKAREAELRIRTRAMEDAEVPITMADATREDNPIVYANGAFERVTGYSKADITGRNCRVLQGPRTDPDDVATLRAGIQAHRPVTVQLLNYRKDGTPFWNRITVTPIQGETGRVVRYLGFQEDVTEQQRTIRLVELLNRVLRHNLRNELTVIEGYTDLIENPPPEVDVQAKIRRPLRRLVSLSEQARQLEQLAKRGHQPARLDPETLFADAAADHRDAYPTATIETAVDTGRGICAGRELAVALDELLTNALTHDPNGDTVVSLSAHDDGDWVVLTVADDGPGIPQQEMNVIERGQETPLEHGKGLGLWLVNWVVTHYGGSFVLERDDGTIATLCLPAITDDQSVESAARRPTALLR